MFTYKKEKQIEIEVERPNYKTYLQIHDLYHGTYLGLMDCFALIYHAFLVQDKEKRNSILNLACDIASDMEIVNTLLILLKGEDIRYIDVTNANTLQYERIPTHPISNYTSFIPVDDFTLLLLNMIEKEKEYKRAYLNIYTNINDKKVKSVLSFLIYQSKKRIHAYRSLLIKDNTHSQTTFKNGYEYENIDDLDSGNYFDPRSPIFIPDENK